MEYFPRQLPLPGDQESIFLFGPRGTGKSLWLTRQYRDALYLDLLNPELYRRLIARPERLREYIEGAPEKQYVIIDEIQRVPELLSLVHLIMDSNRDIQFILTGSSTRRLKREGVDLLAGRAILYTCHPFILSELKHKIDPEEALIHGLIPLIITSSDPDTTLASYIDLYLKEEIRQEGLIRNLGNFSRFLETISFSHGSVLNQSEVARESEVERKTVAGYIQILEDMLLSIRIPVFTRRAKRQLIRHEKFYFFDTGVFRTIRPRGPLDRPSEIEGMALEGLVMQHLKAWIDYSRGHDKLYFWHTKSGTEVDFIIYGEHTFLAIEVKSGTTVRRSQLKGLKAFCEDYPEATGILIYRGKEAVKLDGILCLDWQDFLGSIRIGKALI